MGGGISNASFAQGQVNQLAGKTMIYRTRSTTDSTETVYTVTAGKTFYLCYATLNLNATTDGRYVSMYIDSIGNYLLFGYTNVDAAKTLPRDTSRFPLILPNPIPIPSGSSIIIFSSGTGAWINAHIMGWEE